MTIQCADPEDLEQRKAFLETDLAEIESEFRVAKQRATFRALDKNGDGDSQTSSHSPLTTHNHPLSQTTQPAGSHSPLTIK